MKSVLVVGGGLGGVAAANLIRQRLGQAHRVALVERSEAVLFRPSLPWLVAGQREFPQIERSLRPLERRGIEVVQADVTGLHPAERRIATSAGEMRADFVVLALGAERANSAVPGLKEAGFGFYCRRSAELAREAVEKFAGGTVAVVVAGSEITFPPAPYEMAMLLADRFASRGVRAEVHLYTPEESPLPVLGAAAGDAIRRMLEARGVGWHPGRQLARVEAKELVFADGGRARFDLLLHAPPHRAPALARDAGLTGPDGWVAVDPGTLRTSHPGVYAIGDMTGIRLPSGRPLPKTGGFAHAQAEVVAEQIAVEVAGGGTPHRFAGAGAWLMAAGKRRGALVRGNFYAASGPAARVLGPSMVWPFAKVLFERRWLGQLAGA